jgi:hypothetical protein
VALRISVWDSKEIQAILLAMRGLDRDLKKEIRKATKSVIEPVWKEAVRGEVTTRLETRVLSDTARVAVSDQNVMLKSAAVGRSLSGGYKPSELVGGAEFGADREAKRSYGSVSVKGKSFNVKNRRTNRQFRSRNTKGYVVYAAAAQVIPRIAALWVQTTVRTFHEKMEGK